MKGGLASTGPPVHRGRPVSFVELSSVSEQHTTVVSADASSITFALVAIAAGLVSAGCRDEAASTADRATVVVFAAVSVKEVVESLEAEFERTARADVEISLGPSNQLATQIMAGAPAEVFISANTLWADKLSAVGLVQSEVRFLANRLVLVVRPETTMTSPQELLKDGVRVALAGENAPAGQYAEQALRRLGLFDALASAGKIVRGGDVRVTLSYVELGEVDAGVVYATDGRASKKVQAVYVFDENMHDPIRYPIVLLHNAAPRKRAAEFYEFLASGQAKRAFEAAGFTIVDGD